MQELSFYKPKNFVIKIEEDAKKANALNWDIKLFIVMTSLSRDTYIQKSIINSQKNIPFKIRILFWEDIEEAILSNNELFRKYYPNYNNTDESVPIIVLNEMIGKIQCLHSAIKNANRDWKCYQVANDMETDRVMYEQCEFIFNCAYDINEIKVKWYLQLYKLGIMDNLEFILNFVPTFYPDDVMGTGQVFTISDYIIQFCNTDNFREFDRKAKELIDFIVQRDNL